MAIALIAKKPSGRWWLIQYADSTFGSTMAKSQEKWYKENGWTNIRTVKDWPFKAPCVQSSFSPY